MRILNLCVETDRIMGGRGEMNAQVMPRLHALGHQVTFVSVFDDWVVRPPFETSAPKERWPFVSDTQCGIASQVLHSIVMHCAKLGNRFDVILAHDWDMMFPAEQLSKLWGIPWIACFHLFQHEMALVEGRATDEASLMPIQCEWSALAAADRVTCVSHSMASYARRNMVDRDIEVVHNGVEVPEPAELLKDGGKLRLLYMGRVATQKGFQAVLDLAESTDEFDITFCGKHAALRVEDAEATPEMQRVRKLERLPHFHYHGWVSREDRHKHYQACDMVVMPSIAEPFGIVGLEAMAHARPLLTTRADGIAEFADESNSWRIEPNWQSIRTTALNVASSPEVSSSKVHEGLRTAKSFTWDAAAAKYSDLIKETVHGHSRIRGSGGELRKDCTGRHCCDAKCRVEAR
jgi:glycosyltransferase involved in cell wall biosynthesis